jgi:tRNA threonylcarbamoyl adenosine modification protein (Sua5/YciO/YrdC/YwlC family)
VVPTLGGVARYYDVHPQNPQRRTIGQVVGLLREDGLIVYPTDSGFALGCRIDAREAVERIKTLRRLDDRHHFTLVCRDFAQLGHFVEVSNPVFRAVKAATPGPFTFILPASKEVPRRLAHPRKRTVGVRIPDNAVVRDLLDELGEPLLSSTLLFPGESEPPTEGWDVAERVGNAVDAVLDSGDQVKEPTTVVDLSGPEPEIVRQGAGEERVWRW